MMTMEVFLWGIVQGVGMRPFISRLARQHGIRGRVRNEGGGVRIVASGEPAALQRFCRDLDEKKPHPSRIVLMEQQVCEGGAGCDGFIIEESHDGAGDMIFISPDLSLCGSCLRELFDGNDPRFRHPLISCMECGPRYSIIDAVPYDRRNTSMAGFEMCGFCGGQYADVSDRRYHAQTVSCHQCGPQPAFEDEKGRCAYGEAALEGVIGILKKGGIAAVKGIGGYHLACSPFEEEAVGRLRLLKGRDEKPFAVMFGDIAGIERYCTVSDFEKQTLLSKERPIVLLQRKDEAFPEAVCGSSRYIGAFLPYTPMQYLILEKTGPLVMTSANRSGAPIIKDEAAIRAFAAAGIEGVLRHDREIRTEMDDSVLRCTEAGLQFIRRARGYVPLPLYMKGKSAAHRDVLACGGQTKGSFCLGKYSGSMRGTLFYVSQHIGELEELEAQSFYMRALERMKRLFAVEPGRVCCDLHPDYFTTRLAETLGLEIKKVQHHFAHIASVMAEHGIMDEVIGVAFDGTGYGTDGRIWGGEFLICSPWSFTRAAHLKYVPLVGGDAAVRDAQRTAWMYLYQAGLEERIRDQRWPLVKAALLNRINTIEASSMGRLFDAASALLGIRQTARYEGQCAVELEKAAYTCCREGGAERLLPFQYDIGSSGASMEVDVGKCIRALLEEARGKAPIEELAYRFHRTVSSMTVDVCLRLREKHRINKVALSGGVFQNGILLDMVVQALAETGFEIYSNSFVPPNDGGIALGQAYIGVMD